MDVCGEDGEASGILDWSNFVATTLQLRSNFASEVPVHSWISLPSRQNPYRQAVWGTTVKPFIALDPAIQHGPPKLQCASPALQHATILHNSAVLCSKEPFLLLTRKIQRS